MKRLILFLMLIFWLNCYAEDINLDGDFTDWVDKPSITTETEDVQPVSDSKQEKTDTAKETTVTADDSASSGTSADTSGNSAAIKTVNSSDTAADSNTNNGAAPAATAPAGADENVKKDATATAAPEAASETAAATAAAETPEVNATGEPSSSPDTSSDNEDNTGPKHKISQLKWSMSENSDMLYIMLRFAYRENNIGKITTELVTDYGTYNAVTSYDVSDSSVITSVEGFSSTDGSCEIINKNFIYMEYSIPIADFIKDMKWGYMIKMRVHTDDDTEPKKDYIIISTAGTAPYTGIAICILLSLIVPYYLKRKRKEKNSCIY